MSGIRMSRFPRLKVAVTVAAGIALMPGCGDRGYAPPDASGVLHLEFWNGFSGPDGATMDKLVKQFNKENRDIQVRVQVIPWGTYYDKVTLGLAFGGAPDVFVLHAPRVPEYAAHRALAPVDELVNTHGPDPADFMPRQWEAGIANGVRYGLPLDCHPLALYYNVKLFREAGIEKPPTNAEEFREVARKLTDPSRKQWGFVITDFHLIGMTMLSQFGGGLMAPDLKRSALDTPGSLAAVDAMIGWVKDGKICPKPDPGGAWPAFQTGKAAMAMQGPWMIDSLANQKDQEFAAAPVPQFGTQKAVWAGSHCLVMPAKLPTERQRAAWKFIKYLSDNSLAWAKAGQVPVRTSILNSPEFKALKIQSEFAKQLPYVVYEPFSVAVNQTTTFADIAVEAAVQGVEPAEDALKQAARRVNRVLKVQAGADR
jgi:multiple sugar transport system substrate-binding protein